MSEFCLVTGRPGEVSWGSDPETLTEEHLPAPCQQRVFLWTWSTNLATRDLFSLLIIFPKEKSVSAVNEQLIRHELMGFQEGKMEKFYGFWFNPIYNISCVEESLSLVLPVFQAIHFKSLGSIRIYLFIQKIFISHEFAELQEAYFNHLLTWDNIAYRSTSKSRKIIKWLSNRVLQQKPNHFKWEVPEKHLYLST